MYSVSPELYHRYKDEILRLSLAVQRYIGTRMDRTSSCLTDQQIAEKLGLDERDVREIRCIAEADSLSLEDYEEAERFKRERSRRFGSHPT